MLKKILLSFLLLLTFSTIVLADVIGPDGITREYYGRKEFFTEDIRVDLQNPDVVIIKMATNYPLNQVTYNISDVYLKVNEKDTIAIKMTGKDKGKVLLNPIWKDSKQVFGDINEYCKDAITGEYIKVEASGGKVIGKAMIIEKQIEKKKWEITIIIAKKVLEGMNITIEFATAKCGNSLVSEEFYVAKAERPCPPSLPYKIDPSFTNNNPVVPYYNPSFSDGGWGGAWGGGFGGYDYPFWDGGGYIPCPPPVPVPASIIMVVSGIIIMVVRKSS